MALVLLAGKDWTARALLRAQLIEEGFDAMGYESIEGAVKCLWSSRVVPSLLIADLFESDNPAKDISTLSQWAKTIPIWVLADHGVAGQQLEGRGFERILYRPVDLGRLVKEIKDRLAG